jgi:hypothetical protein
LQTVDKGHKTPTTPKQNAPKPVDPMSIINEGDTFDGLDPLSMFMAEQTATKKNPTSGRNRDRVRLNTGELFSEYGEDNAGFKIAAGDGRQFQHFCWRFCNRIKKENKTILINELLLVI